MKGIDISAWQENMDWQSIVDNGTQFVIIKLGESCKLDSVFIDHVNNAITYGLKYGIYYYAKATNTEQAQQEADWVDSQIKEYLNGVNPEMGIWYDMEDNIIVNVGANITSICSAFISGLNAIGYIYVGIYSSYNWFTNGNIDTTQLNVPYWCAQYNYQCDFVHDNLKIWQYTDNLKIGEHSFDGNEYFE
jgi:GH25 family lysozyme M1 (1,4-beta-N-acetylmuramidase)